MSHERAFLQKRRKQNCVYVLYSQEKVIKSYRVSSGFLVPSEPSNRGPSMMPFPFDIIQNTPATLDRYSLEKQMATSKPHSDFRKDIVKCSFLTRFVQQNVISPFCNSYRFCIKSHVESWLPRKTLQNKHFIADVVLDDFLCYFRSDEVPVAARMSDL